MQFVTSASFLSVNIPIFAAILIKKSSNMQLSDQESARRENLEEARALGINPYPAVSAI